MAHHFPPIPDLHPAGRTPDSAPDSAPDSTLQGVIADRSGSEDDDTIGATPLADEDTDVTDLGTELVADLATDRSGLAIIYRALDGLVARYELRDAAVVIDESGLGRQVFRAARKPLDDPGGEALLDAEPGLYTDPPLENAMVDVALLNSLCVVALRMEVLRYDSWHDPLTSLFDRRSFDRLLEMSVAAAPGPTGRSRWSSSTSTASSRSTTVRVTRPATRRSKPSASASAASCDSVTTRRASAATSSR